MRTLVRPTFYPDTGTWEFCNLRTRSLRELVPKLAALGYGIADYYPDGYRATFDGKPDIARAYDRATLTESSARTADRHTTYLKGVRQAARNVVKSSGGLTKRTRQPRERSKPLYGVRPWTAKDDAELKRLVEGGMSALATAAALGRTRASVIGRADRVNLRWASRKLD